jgi:hypothetical protein
MILFLALLLCPLVMTLQLKYEVLGLLLCME